MYEHLALLNYTFFENYKNKAQVQGPVQTPDRGERCSSQGQIFSLSEILDKPFFRILD